jgi:hypothetical protein
MGIAVPLGWLPADTLSAGRLQALLGHPGARLVLLGSRSGCSCSTASTGCCTACMT